MSRLERGIEVAGYLREHIALAWISGCDGGFVSHPVPGRAIEPAWAWPRRSNRTILWQTQKTGVLLPLFAALGRRSPPSYGLRAPRPRAISVERSAL